ncbi:MAG: galactokinase [Ruminococcaceae bacterium]|nr:galactokinase [Oscillospiraceae bacterium]
MKIFVPGRTEIIGNHTDHQLGRVIASAVKPGMTAECQRLERKLAEVQSGKRKPMVLELNDLSPRKEEEGSTMALIRGVCQALEKRGYKVGGFTAKVNSELRSGGGLSSSAAFCVLIGRIISELYNGGGIDAVTIARCAQEAENIHFGKPSGLMDQLACSIGKPVYIDFLTEEIVPIDCDFGRMGLALCLTDTGGSHSNLTADYASIRQDMSAVAHAYGKEVLAYVNQNEFAAKGFDIRSAALRAEHFFEENERVPLMKKAMEQFNRDECLRIMNLSGRSSEEKLRNIRCAAGDDRLEKGLELSAKLLEGKGAWRVHGGGFAGCVQALVPEDYLASYAKAMDASFGLNSCFRIM